MKLKDKVAVITGAASGIGKAIAILYAQEGANVVVSDLNLAGAKETAAKIEANGGAAIALMTNVAKDEDIRQMIDTAVTTYGTVDILVNNAGIMDNYDPAENITDELWERIFAVNTNSVMRSTRKVLPIFLAKGAGVIINIASVAGLHGSIAGATYTASKHAVVGFTKNVGFQYSIKGIRCNAIAPGAVATNIGSTITAPNKFGMERCSAGLVLNPRTGQPEEIAKIALFLASDDASFVNGHVLVADSGWTAY
ncbi:MAG TPA: SDR family oxidoreductase [Desulfitobacteriaceae bacterium]|nr:SDR family oxidoreductase [Desulfitobacteriaceae bacterium]